MISFICCVASKRIRSSSKAVSYTHLILLDICKEYGVDTTYIKKVPAQGGHTIIQVDKEGRNNIILYGGTNQMQSRDCLLYTSRCV